MLSEEVIMGQLNCCVCLQKMDTSGFSREFVGADCQYDCPHCSCYKITAWARARIIQMQQDDCYTSQHTQTIQKWITENNNKVIDKAVIRELFFKKGQKQKRE